MKRFFRLPVLALCLSLFALPLTVPLITGCTTPIQRQTVNTLFTLGSGVDAAYKGYLDLIIAGKLATNSIPKVSQSYALFQTAFGAAITLAAGNTNASPTTEVLTAAASFNNSVAAAKKGTP